MICPYLPIQNVHFSQLWVYPRLHATCRPKLNEDPTSGWSQQCWTWSHRTYLKTLGTNKMIACTYDFLRLRLYIYKSIMYVYIHVCVCVLWGDNIYLNLSIDLSILYYVTILYIGKYTYIIYIYTYKFIIQTYTYTYGHVRIYKIIAWQVCPMALVVPFHLPLNI